MDPEEKEDMKSCAEFVSLKDQDSGIWERAGEDEEHNSTWSDDTEDFNEVFPENQIRQEEVPVLAS